MLKIEVLGVHCFNCERLGQTVREVLDELSSPLPHELVIVTDAFDIAKYGVLRLPALVIDDRVLCTGRLPTREQILDWIHDAQAAVIDDPGS